MVAGSPTTMPIGSCSRDPIGYLDGPNQSQFCANMPLIGVDPSGLQIRVIPRTFPTRPAPAEFPRLAPGTNPSPPTAPNPNPLNPPFIPPMPTGGPTPNEGPTTNPCQDPNPWWDPAAQDLPPPGRCTPARYGELQTAKYNACENPHPKGCGWHWGKKWCQEFSDREQQWDKCAKARLEIMNECFGGGNQTHRDEWRKAKDQKDKCADKWFYYCLEDCIEDIVKSGHT
jgi:hypothetical protein